MQLPRLSLPFLLIRPHAEEAGFWLAQRQYLQKVDVACALCSTLVYGTVALVYWDVSHRKLDVAGWLLGPLLILAGVAAVQVVVMLAARGWWQRHRGRLTVAVRFAHAAKFVPLFLRLRAGAPPYHIAMRQLGRDVFKLGVGTEQPLPLSVGVRFLLSVTELGWLMPQPLLFPLPFVQCAVMQVLEGVTYAWLAATPTHAAEVVDQRLVAHSYQLCVALGWPAQALGELLLGPLPSSKAQCARGGVPLPQQFVLAVCGVVAPVTLTWLAEHHLKTLYVMQRARQLGMQEGVTRAQCEAQPDFWQGLSQWLLFCVRVVSVLALAYAGLWQLLALDAHKLLSC